MWLCLCVHIGVRVCIGRHVCVWYTWCMLTTKGAHTYGACPLVVARAGERLEVDGIGTQHGYCEPNGMSST